MEWIKLSSFPGFRNRPGANFLIESEDNIRGVFDVDGRPLGQAKKYNWKMKRVYYSKEEMEYRENIRMAFSRLFNLKLDDPADNPIRELPIIGNNIPIEVYIKAQFAMPKSRWKKKFDDNAEFMHTRKPDYDNISKMVCDSLNGFLFHDDKQITRGTIEKVEVHPDLPSFLRIGFRTV